MVERSKLVRNCGIPREYADKSLEDMDFSIYGADMIEPYLRKELSRLRGGTYRQDPLFLMIDGTYGNGKTRTACHLVEAAYTGFLDNPAARGDVLRPYFAMAQRAAAHRFDDAADIRAYLESSIFLALDDVNRLAGYKGEQEFIEYVIEDRYYRGLSTVVTMNVGFEMIDGRLRSFLKQFVRLQYADAADQRSVY